MEGERVSLGSTTGESGSESNFLWGGEKRQSGGELDCLTTEKPHLEKKIDIVVGQMKRKRQ